MAGAKVPNLTFVSSACKTMASDTAMADTTDAVQLLGGYGYVRDHPRRADAARRQDHPDL
jgi:alkylation response protein AidB-like acyl-CoA dehydrogenase